MNEEWDCWLCEDTKEELVHVFEDGEKVREYMRPCSFCCKENKLRNIGEEFVASLKRWSLGIIMVIGSLVALLVWKW